MIMGTREAGGAWRARCILSFGSVQTPGVQPFTVHPRCQMVGYINDIIDEVHATTPCPITSLLRYTSTQDT